MGNFAVKNDMPESEGTITRFNKLNRIGEHIYKESLLKIQQQRSYVLSNIEKDDFWDSKNMFRAEVSQIIEDNNLQCRTMEELEQVVLNKVKRWIKKE